MCEILLKINIQVIFVSSVQVTEPMDNGLQYINLLN